MPCEAPATDDVSANDVAVKKIDTIKTTMRFIAIRLLSFLLFHATFVSYFYEGEGISRKLRIFGTYVAEVR